MLIKPYSPHWPHQFEQIRLILDKALTGLDYNIEHVGSTSVPELAAKAIIDINIIYDREAEFEQIKTALSGINYYHNGDQGIPLREAFKRSNSVNHPVLDRIPHHLYVCVKGSAPLNRHLLFRDHLRRSAEARETYESMKYALAARANQDRKRYAALKELHANDFIDSVIEAERQSTSNTKTNESHQGS